MTKISETYKLIAFAVFVLGVAFLVLKDQKKVERFQSAGTILQLATSHVPTRGELRRDRRREHQQIRQDLLDLTESF